MGALHIIKEITFLQKLKATHFPSRQFIPKENLLVNIPSEQMRYPGKIVKEDTSPPSDNLTYRFRVRLATTERQKTFYEQNTQMQGKRGITSCSACRFRHHNVRST